MSVNYKSYEFQCYEYISRLEKILHMEKEDKKLKAWCSKLEQLKKNLEYRRFRVAVVGEFNRGKSSFVNALLGKEILPSDCKPTTATINRITYADTPNAYILFKNGKRKNVEIIQLADYVTKLTESTTEMAQQIKEAVVEYPSLFCRNGVDLLDTPGMNDDEAMNSVTVAQLEDIDLAIVAIDANMPFSMTECKFTANLLKNPQICQIVIVITKIDMIRERERERLLNYVNQRVQKEVKAYIEKYNSEDTEIFKKYNDVFLEPIVFGVSSLDALDAISCNDMELFEKSGFKLLNDKLPEIIMVSQNSSSILNSERELRHILNEYQNYLIEKKEWEKILIPQLNVMKQTFAEVAYKQTRTVFQIKKENISKFLPPLEEEFNFTRKQFIKALSEMKELDYNELKRVFLPVTKEEYKELNIRLHKKEKENLSYYEKHNIKPLGEKLCKTLKEIVFSISGLEEVFSFLENFYEQLRQDLRLVNKSFSFIETEEIESFYWEINPLPNIEQVNKDWQIMSYVNNVIVICLKNYYKRREEQIYRMFQASQKHLEEEIQKLVLSIYKNTAFYIEILNKQQEEKLIKVLVKLEQEIQITKQQFLNELLEAKEKRRE